MPILCLIILMRYVLLTKHKSLLIALYKFTYVFYLHLDIMRRLVLVNYLTRIFCLFYQLNKQQLFIFWQNLLGLVLYICLLIYFKGRAYTGHLYPIQSPFVLQTDFATKFFNVSLLMMIKLSDCLHQFTLSFFKMEFKY